MPEPIEVPEGRATDRMSFLDQIFASLETSGDRPILVELRDSARISATGRDLLTQIAQARAFLASRHLSKGDRVALLAPNSIDWVAMDLAIMAEGLVVVPLYSRQAAPELFSMMKDCSPSLIICGDAAMRNEVCANWAEAPPQILFKEAFASRNAADTSRAGAPAPHPDSDPVAIIYTSGTSGEAKGVILNPGNISHMLGC